MATVVVLPALLLSFWLVLQYALVLHVEHVAQAAAQDGALAGASGSGDPGATARAVMAGAAGGFTAGVGVASRTSATRITVTVRADVIRIFPIGSYSVTASGSAPREEFVPQPERP